MDDVLLSDLGNLTQEQAPSMLDEDRSMLVLELNFSQLEGLLKNCLRNIDVIAVDHQAVVRLDLTTIWTHHRDTGLQLLKCVYSS